MFCAKDFSEPNYAEIAARNEIELRVNNGNGEDALEYIVERVACGAVSADLAFNIVEDLHEAAHEPMPMCSCAYHQLLVDMYMQFSGGLTPHAADPPPAGGPDNRRGTRAAGG